MIITNEYNSFYFLKVRQKKKKKKFFSDLKQKLHTAKGRDKTDLFVQKQYLEEFTGMINQTYSFLNLLQLEKIEEAIEKQ